MRLNKRRILETVGIASFVTMMLGLSPTPVGFHTVVLSDLALKPEPSHRRNLEPSHLFSSS
jgi:hypothetical protein